ATDVREADRDDELLALARGLDDAVADERVAGGKGRAFRQVGRRIALGDDDFAPLRDEPLRRGAAGRAAAEDHDPAAHRLVRMPPLETNRAIRRIPRTAVSSTSPAA